MKLSFAIKKLKEAGVPDAAYDARAIFEEFGKLEKKELYGNDPDVSSDELILAVERRAKREPLQYIIGRAYFYGEEYKVSRDCLIPRQDTEILVEQAIARIPKGKRFADLCTGSGCVGISVLKHTDSTTAVLADISDGALALARENASRNGVEERAIAVHHDVLSGIVEGGLFAVLSNPPYVSEAAYAVLEREIYFEPKIAFVGKDDGAEFYKKLIPLYRDSIDKEGFIAFEIGFDQGDLLRSLADGNSMNCEIIKDLSGNDRVAVLTLN